VVVQARDRADGRQAIRAGFTATKRIGGAVVRNRAKRRLRCDYVVIARGGTALRPWDRLLDDIKSALISLAANQVPAPAAPPAAFR
jgi:ribonuclease P protein component